MIIAIVILVLLVLWGLLGYNSLVRKKNSLEGAWAGIDVQLKRRFDLIPNLVETVKGYAAHEKEVLEQVTKARNMVAGAGNAEERMEAENNLGGALGRLIAVAESYPDLKANQNFLQLQEELSTTENNIERARRKYNDQVMSYRAAIRQFPTVILARLFNFSEQPYFEAEKQERENVKVKF